MVMISYNEGKQKFIEDWGMLGTNWGISKTQAQIHAFLLTCPDKKCANEIMDHLHISRGNTNQNLRLLVEWGLVHKKTLAGDRKEYFVAEKDMWTILRRIIAIRKKKELEPMITALRYALQVEAHCHESEAFCQLVKDLYHFSNKADAMLESIISLESDEIVNRLFNTMSFDDV